jgi:hypothetical protein
LLVKNGDCFNPIDTTFAVDEFIKSERIAEVGRSPSFPSAATASAWS